MKPEKLFPWPVLILALTLAVLIAGCRPTADEALNVRDAWARPSPQGAPAAAFYLTIENQTSSQDELQQVYSDNCETVEIHLTQMDDEGVMRMAPVSGGQLSIAPGETVTLAPGGLHIMCIGLRAPLVQGQDTELTLEFANAGVLTVPVTIRQDEP